MSDALSYEARARAALETNEFRFSKKLGQNFILSDSVMECIADEAEVTDGDAVLEIGPGAGSLTAALLRRGAGVLAIEVDEGLEPVLEGLFGNNKSLELRFADIRKCDISSLASDMDELWSPNRKIVAANLPYYITTDVLASFAKSDAHFDRLIFMVQREAADRIMAKIGDKQYCLLSAQIAWKYETERAMELPRELFTPAPHVDSTLIRLTPRKEPPAPVISAETLQRTMSAAFLMRRKTMVNNICAAFGIDRARAQAAIEYVGLKVDIRGEAINQRDMARLSDAIYEMTRT